LVGRWLDVVDIILVGQVIAGYEWSDVNWLWLLGRWVAVFGRVVIGGCGWLVNGGWVWLAR